MNRREFLKYLGFLTIGSIIPHKIFLVPKESDFNWRDNDVVFVDNDVEWGLSPSISSSSACSSSASSRGGD